MRDDIVAKLDAHLERYRGMPFVYGASDCVMFVAAWLKALGLHAPVPVYGSLHEGARFLVALDLPDVAAAVDGILQRRPVAAARVGDLVAHGDTGALGICIGGPRAAFLGIERGVRIWPLGKCRAAWSVEPCLA